MLLHIIADYGPGDLAFAEVIQRLTHLLPDAVPVVTPVPAFSALAAGFCIAQLGLNDAPLNTLIYHNVAPRSDDDASRQSNAGERLAFARLPTGVRVIGVNADTAFSFVRDCALELRWVNVESAGSQFRSRDLFPRAAAAIIAGEAGVLGDAIQTSDIPDVPSAAIAYVDGYGNLKTTIRESEIKDAHGQKRIVRIAGRENEVVVSDGSFGVQPGDIAFAPGSSGWKDASGAQVQWVEIFLRSGNAWEEFGRPAVGTQIELVEAKKPALLSRSAS
jgi:hypothetical protein